MEDEKEKEIGDPSISYAEYHMFLL
jgi:type I protein arginine methyltransferase